MSNHGYQLNDDPYSLGVKCAVCAAPIPNNEAHMLINDDHIEMSCLRYYQYVPKRGSWWRRLLRAAGL